MLLGDETAPVFADDVAVAVVVAATVVAAEPPDRYEGATAVEGSTSAPVLQGGAVGLGGVRGVGRAAVRTGDGEARCPCKGGDVRGGRELVEVDGGVRRDL